MQRRLEGGDVRCPLLRLPATYNAVATARITPAAAGAAIGAVTTTELAAPNKAGVVMFDAGDKAFTSSLAQFKGLGAIRV